MKKYKEEKIGLNWIMAEVSSKENSSQTATVYTRNTGLFEDSYHVYYYFDEIKAVSYTHLQKRGLTSFCFRRRGQCLVLRWSMCEVLWCARIVLAK